MYFMRSWLKLSDFEEIITEPVSNHIQPIYFVLIEAFIIYYLRSIEEDDIMCFLSAMNLRHNYSPHFFDCSFKAALFFDGL